MIAFTEYTEDRQKHRQSTGWNSDVISLAGRFSGFGFEWTNHQPPCAEDRA